MILTTNLYIIYNIYYIFIFHVSLLHQLYVHNIIYDDIKYGILHII